MNLTTNLDPRALQLKADFDETIRRHGLLDLAAETGIQTSVSHTEAVLMKIITADEGMEAIKGRVRKLAAPDINLPVLILGETGTGKEYIAHALHGDRKPSAFKALNCGAIPSELLESELFGYKKGAFTGATMDKKGLIEGARGGTLFLDEIGDMPKLLQCKMLRVLQEKRYCPVGSDTEIEVNFRVISATNHLDLLGKEPFREDLYYRLAGHVITLPPLKERNKLDISLIVTRFARDVIIAERILVHLMQNNPPLNGNIRELLNIIEEFNALY